ncbi:MAG: hypothetical protein HY602_01200 [Parcubacteria group bacterium]|nr:hypothetical protein [Parcubacteria group bacterium]
MPLSIETQELIPIPENLIKVEKGIQNLRGDICKEFGISLPYRLEDMIRDIQRKEGGEDIKKRVNELIGKLRLFREEQKNWTNDNIEQYNRGKQFELKLGYFLLKGKILDNLQFASEYDDILRHTDYFTKIEENVILFDVTLATGETLQKKRNLWEVLIKNKPDFGISFAKSKGSLTILNNCIHLILDFTPRDQDTIKKLDDYWNEIGGGEKAEEISQFLSNLVCITVLSEILCQEKFIKMNIRFPNEAQNLYIKKLNSIKEYFIKKAEVLFKD